MSGQVRSSVNLGLGPQALSGSQSNSGSANAFPYETYQTPLLDLTMSQLGIEIIPARPGHIPLLFQIFWIMETLSGTQVTPLQAQMGSNAAHNNLAPLSSAPSNATVNGFTTPFYTRGGASAGNGTQQIPNSPVFLDVVSGAQGTGGFALKGRLLVATYWVAIGGNPI